MHFLVGKHVFHPFVIFKDKKLVDTQYNASWEGRGNDIQIINIFCKSFSLYYFLLHA